MIAPRDRSTRAMETDVEAAITEVRSVTRELDSPSDLTALVERLSDTQYVLLGEASHGTSEYYRWRSWLSAQLIQKHDFSFVAVEGDWTDCYEVNRYVKGLDDEMTAREVLSAFERWPTWMWANWEVLEFLEWLASYNEGRTEGEMAGFYGLDVYSLFESMRALIEYLDDIDPDAAADARDAYRCFEPYSEDAREYARAVRLAPNRAKTRSSRCSPSLSKMGRTTVTIIQTSDLAPSRMRSLRKTRRNIIGR